MNELTNAFDYENGFYHTCSPQRISKFVGHYELFKKTLELSGDIIEFGVFKGASLSRFALLRAMFGATESKKLIGFDIFGEFPPTHFEGDQLARKRFIDAAGASSISSDDMMSSLEARQLSKNVELVKGDIVKTLPLWLKDNLQARFSLVNLDTDIYEPAVTILENIWPRIVKGGVLMLDDYGVFPGETKAADEFFKDMNIEIKKFSHAKSPSYIIK